ncbi:hypothetical protein LY76DRAFT_157827 [Colletotrichum caudatum]|nr:hypothetical protein LY76DRAFT_157827 [Colletotrichum caudatum]
MFPNVETLQQHEPACKRGIYLRTIAHNNTVFRKIRSSTQVEKLRLGTPGVTVAPEDAWRAIRALGVGQDKSLIFARISAYSLQQTLPRRPWSGFLRLPIPVARPLKPNKIVLPWRGPGSHGDAPRS